MTKKMINLDDAAGRLVGPVCEKELSTTKNHFSFTPQTLLKTRKNMLHARPRPYKCLNCDSIFDRPSQLNYHMRSIHLGEKTQVCQICGKGFFRKNDLRTHLNVHLGTNQSVCKICGRKFNHVSNLIRHSRTHKGLRPYPCRICGKRFTQLSSLGRHKIIHKRESCNLPDNDLGLGDSEKHMKLGVHQSTKRRHYCRRCGESFEFMVLLRQHEAVHSKIDTSFFGEKDCAMIQSESCDNENGIKTESTKNAPVVISTIEHFCHEESSNILEKTRYHVSDQNSINSIEEHLLDLPSKTDVIELESGHNATINIYDILSPYDCDSIGLLNSDTLEPKLSESLTTDHKTSLKNANKSDNTMEEINNTTDSLDPGVYFATNIHQQLLNNSTISTSPINCFNQPNSESRESTEIKNKIPALLARDNYSQYLQVDFIEICDHEYLNTNLHAVDLHEFENVGLFDEAVFDAVDHNVQSTNSESTNAFVGPLAIITEMGNQLILNNSNELQIRNLTPKQLEDSIEPSCQSKTDEALQLLPNSENLPGNVTQVPSIRLVPYPDGKIYPTFIREQSESEKNQRAKDSFAEKSPEFSIDLVEPGDSDAFNSSENSSAIIQKVKAPSLVKYRKRKFQCAVCENSFSTAYNLKQHKGTHFSDHQQFQCKHCGVSFAWKSSLNKHMARNHQPDGLTKSLCSMCPKFYNTQSQLNEHVKRDHLKERPHACNDCGKGFFKRYDLKTHMRIHTNERPYSCLDCGKTFVHPSHIKRHERIHSGEKPYVCDVCEKAFAQRSSLKTHRRTTHRDNVKIVVENTEDFMDGEEGVE